MSSDGPVDTKMKSEADRALAMDYKELNCPGFESSRIFALTSAILANPVPGGMTRSRLLRTVNAIFLFIVHPTSPLDPSNPRTKPTKHSSGGALRPAMWYVDMKRKGEIGRGQPPKTILGRKRKADIVIECSECSQLMGVKAGKCALKVDRDLIDLTTGKVTAARLFNNGRLKVKGDLDRALRMATILSHERSKIYGTNPGQAPAVDPELGVREAAQGNLDYSDGAPAPYNADVGFPRSRL